MIKANGKFIAVNWNSSGGGAFAVIPVNEVGKAPDQIPLFRGHTAQVLDTDFNPFDDNMIVSASDDGKIGVWEIPEDYSFHSYLDEDGKPKDIKPVRFLTGHSRKVGHVLFHPTAKDVLASSSLDYTVKIWNVADGEVKFTLKHPDMVTSMSFSYNGDHLATVSRDKKLRVWDIRSEKIVSEGPAHSGAKNQRVVWLGDSDRIATTGFSRLSDRQIGIWEAFDLEKGNLGGFYNMDQSSGILMPFYDESNRILYVAGKGDGNIRYYEFQNDELFELSEYQSVEPQRGFAVAPKRSVNVKENEVFKAYKTVGDHYIEPISFYVPRKAEVFQDDIYPDAPSNKPALSAEEWLGGKSVDGPILFKVHSLYDGTKTEFIDSKKESKPINKIEVTIEVDNNPNDATPVRNSPEPSPTVPKNETPSPVNHQADIRLTGNSSKNSVDELLKKDQSVEKLLQKAADLDADNNAENPSEKSSVWDSEDEKTSSSTQVDENNTGKVGDNDTSKADESKARNSSNKSTSEIITSVSTKSKVEASPDVTVQTQSEANIQTTISVDSPGSKNAEKTRASTPTPSTVEQVVETPDKQEGKSNSAPAQKSFNLKQSVERLSELILHLEAIITKLSNENIAKDERLEKLESKIEQLLKK